MRTETRPGGGFNALRRFTNPEPKKRAAEACEMCTQEIASEHRHLVNLESRSLLCACPACYLLFTHRGAAQGKYRAVPDRYLHLVAFKLSQTQWDQLQIPVGIAFFFLNSSINQIAAFYPSPAGATESQLALDSWRELADANPILNHMEPDVEALLVLSRRGEKFDCFLVPIDACYELTGHVRQTWRGFDGG
ncbi:MAG TPA: DUF5947 family protein, partial [Candidatus Binataceae bacterium]|nr:DUF5947 family protein [Candidatus Binataceae bacterium]